jgi:glycosyltransferase involved in cell wall biosynthesis
MRKSLITQIAYTGFGGLGSVIFSLIAADTPQDRRWAIGFIGDQPLDPGYRFQCETAQIDHAAFQTLRGRPYAAWLRLSRWLGHTRPDVVVCHSLTSVLPCRWYAWWHRACLVVVEHTANEVKTQREWAASRLAMLLADRVVLLTDEYRAQLASTHRWLFRPHKIRIVPNGVDTATFHPATTRRARTALRLGMAGRFSFSKKQGLLVMVTERVRQLRPELDVILSLAGDGPELERVRARAQGSPVAGAIHFEGLMTEHAVARWLRTLDIYVHATDGETLSTALLQAMATGLPIVASKIPGVQNLLGKPGEFGRCVDNDVNAFADAILECIDEPDHAARMGARARARAEAAYSQSVMLERYLQVFDECSAGRWTRDGQL